MRVRDLLGNIGQRSHFRTACLFEILCTYLLRPVPSVELIASHVTCDQPRNLTELGYSIGPRAKEWGLGYPPKYVGS